MKIALDKQTLCWRGITYLQYSGVTSTVYLRVVGNGIEVAVTVLGSGAVKFTLLQLLPEQLSKSHSSMVPLISAKDELFNVQTSSLSDGSKKKQRQ